MAELWCINLIGPDDVIAQPSLADARMYAHTINSSLLEREAGRPLTAHDANVWAVPAPWPHDAESHADDLERQAAETIRMREALAIAKAINGQ